MNGCLLREPLADPMPQPIRAPTVDRELESQRPDLRPEDGHSDPKRGHTEGRGDPLTGIPANPLQRDHSHRTRLWTTRREGQPPRLLIYCSRTSTVAANV